MRTGMSDPNFTAEDDDAPPPKPPRPVRGPRDHTYDEDLLLAQRLQREEQQRAQQGGYQQGYPTRGDSRRGQDLRPNELHDREHSFFDGNWGHQQDDRRILISSRRPARD